MAASDDPGPNAPAALVGAYLAALQRKDVEALRALVTDDFVLEVPLDAGGTNDPGNALAWRGVEDYLTNYCAIFPRIAALRFRDVAIRPTTDAETVYAEAYGDMLLSDGKPYRNRYVFRFDLRDGRIAGLMEFCNPVTSAIAFGRALPVT
jgi:ketosteroid isomerase-like protein